MWNICRSFCAIALSLLLLPSAVVSQTKKKNAKTIKVGNQLVKRKTVFDFGADTIQGDLTRPDGEYFEARRRIKQERLLKLRPNWKKRTLQSISEL